MDGLLLSVLIPVYNNASSLIELHRRLETTLQDACISYEILLVNDGSRDDSWMVIQEIGRNDLAVRGLCLSRNFGQHAAISAALDHAKGDLFVLMDADLQDRPEIIPSLLQELLAGPHDIVYTSKDGGDTGWARTLTSRMFHRYIGTSTGSQTLRDIGTYRVFNRKVANALRAYPERAVVYGPLMQSMGYDTSFILVPRDARKAGKSSYSFSRRLALACQSIVSYSTLPQKFLLWGGGLIIAGSVAYIVLIIVQYALGGGGLPPGMTLMLVLLLSLIGVVMMSLGIIAYYLFLVYREVLSRPRYHVQSAINLEAGAWAN